MPTSIYTTQQVIGDNGRNKARARTSQWAEAPRGANRELFLACRGFLARVSRNMVLVAPPDDRRRWGRFPSYCIRFRGYGLSDPPPEPEKASFLDLIADLLALLDALAISKVFLIGKDFGAILLSLFFLFHQERVSGFVTLGAPFMLPSLPIHHQAPPEGFYISRWQKPGRAEAEFGRLDAKTVVRNVYILFSKSEIPIANENQEIMDLVEPSDPLPHWFSEEDLAVYGQLYEKSGFRTALQVPYRQLGLQLDVPDQKVEVPALLIMGEKDYVFKFPGMSDYIKNGTLKTVVPNLEVVYLSEGTHFVQEQSPDEVNNLIVNFLRRHV